MSGYNYGMSRPRKSVNCFQLNVDGTSQSKTGTIKDLNVDISAITNFREQQFLICHIVMEYKMAAIVGETGDNCNSFWKFGCNCFLIVRRISK